MILAIGKQALRLRRSLIDEKTLAAINHTPHYLVNSNKVYENSLKEKWLTLVGHYFRNTYKSIVFTETISSNAAN
jgi:hypothetical protein